MLRFQRLLTKPWHNPYTAKEAIVREKLIVLESLWSGNEHRPGEMDVREETIARKGTICAINGPDCESKGLPLPHGEAILDHIILRARFKNPKDADRPGNVQIVCTNCHRAKTKCSVSQILLWFSGSYCVGVFSSRKIALACERNVAFMAIVGEARPDFRTISDFRKWHLEAFKEVFVQVVR